MKIIDLIKTFNVEDMAIFISTIIKEENNKFLNKLKENGVDFTYINFDILNYYNLIDYLNSDIDDKEEEYLI